MNKEIKELRVALCGNPNVGKSTVFNALTRMRQHTGNWSGKTVEGAQGRCRHRGCDYIIFDLPGTYSLIPASPEEEAAREFICFGGADVVVVVADACLIERNLGLFLQVSEVCDNIVLCINLIDEAAKRNIVIDYPALEEKLGVPVVPISAIKKSAAFDIFSGISRIKKTEKQPLVRYDEDIELCISQLEKQLAPLLNGQINSRFAALKLIENDFDMIRQIEKKTEKTLPKVEKNDKIHQKVALSVAIEAQEIAKGAVKLPESYTPRDRKIDKILTSKRYGIPIMLLVLAAIFFITIVLSNYPSMWLAALFSLLQKWLNSLFFALKLPQFLHALLLDGVFKTTGWVVAVMLPPMAIFFPLFTIGEDLGYLPRVAFNLDKPFSRCGSCGKQCLTMCMGFGCNAAAVTNARIIGSKNQRLIAILTNNFVPCNGRFPTLIALSGFFVGGLFDSLFLGGLVAAATVISLVLLGIFATLFVSWGLSKTLLKTKGSGFCLELPPYRKPQFSRIFVRSFLDRTVFVLWRAVKVAAPCGLIIFLAGNIWVGEYTLIAHFAQFLEPFAGIFGMDGYIFSAFIFGFPANEIVIPVALMSYQNSSALVDFAGINQLGSLLSSYGWSIKNAVCVLIFTVFHFPCATTTLTIFKETKSLKWTALAILLPTILGFFLCLIINGVFALLGG